MLSRELVKRGHTVMIATPEESALARRARAASIPVFTEVEFKNTKNPFQFFRDIAALARFVREQNFDLVHAHGSRDMWSMALARTIFRLKQPILLTRHNVKRVRFHAFNRWIYRNGIDRLVLTSGAALENYRPFFAAGILDESEAAVIHSSVDIDRFAGPRHPEKIRAELGIQSTTPLIGLVGRIVKDKGPLVLLDAVPEILKEFPDALFILVGKPGKLEQHARDLIKSRGLERSVRLLGFREDIVDITAALDVSVLPTKSESSPAVVKEAMLLGKPVVASRVGGVPEILDEARGILIPPDDPAALARAVIEALRRPPQSDGLPERFTPAFLCESYLKVYEQMKAK
ncbi:MAG TPA: glycosyltransferase family 4 protein [Candidatus Binatia bacterium]|jgi:glycosyltransferase involved in cell wall biosynthesis